MLSTAIAFPDESIFWDLTPYLTEYEYFVYLHFAELVKDAQGKREFTITVNDGRRSSSSLISPKYLKAICINYTEIPIKGGSQIFIAAKPNSKFAPIVNAFEIFQLIELSELPTRPEDGNV